MKNLGYIAGEITKGKNLSENLLKYGNGMCSMYNGLGFIKMSMNYYTVLDIARDLQNDKDLLKMIMRHSTNSIHSVNRLLRLWKL